MSKEYIKQMMHIYSCDYKRNKECNRKHCIMNGGECSHTQQYKYAKRNIINFLKRIINKS